MSVNQLPISMQAPTSRAEQNEADRRLYGRRLILARVFWGVIIVFDLGSFAASLPGLVIQLQTSCTSSCGPWQLSTDAVRTLQHTGLSIGNYAVFGLAVILTLALFSYAIAALLVWRRSTDWMALLVSLMLIGTGPNSFTNTALLSNWLAPWLASILLSLGSQVSVTVLVLVFYLFPDGRFLPRWTRAVVIIGIGASIFFIIFPSTTQSVISALLYFSLLLSLIIAQVYRYRRVSSPVQRQQTKWVVYSIAITIILVLGLFAIPELIFPTLGQAGSLFSAVGNVVGNFLFVLIPISFSIAILRYRLYDIDILINRTLVYLTLTATLALLYIGSIIALQSLLRGIIKQNNDIAIVVSTLAIAALFQPLRHRLQTVIDRRFYRQKYDAAKVMAAFSATLRQEVDLDQLRERLLAVVQETMQPTHVSLWVRQPSRVEIPLSQIGEPTPQETKVRDESAGHGV